MSEREGVVRPLPPLSHLSFHTPKKNEKEKTRTSAAPDVLGGLPERRKIVNAPRWDLCHRWDRNLGHDDDLIFGVASFAFLAAAAAASAIVAGLALDDDGRLHHLDLLVLGVEGGVVVRDVAGGRSVLRVEVGEVADDGELF